jgi:hypothetical protein
MTLVTLVTLVTLHRTSMKSRTFENLHLALYNKLQVRAAIYLLGAALRPPEALDDLLIRAPLLPHGCVGQWVDDLQKQITM